MAGNFETSMAYKAACDLVFKGLAQPSGYTEPLLHAWRSRLMALLAQENQETQYWFGFDDSVNGRFRPLCIAPSYE